MRISWSVVELVSETAIASDWPMVQADLVAHVLYDALERAGCLVSPIGRSLGDLQVKEAWQRQMGWEGERCLWGRLAEHCGLR